MTETRAEGFVTVAKVGEIAPGAVKVVRLDDQEVAIFNLAGTYYAMDDVCTHDGGPLAEGVIEGDVIECPRHGAWFDIATGELRVLDPASGAFIALDPPE